MEIYFSIPVFRDASFPRTTPPLLLQPRRRKNSGVFLLGTTGGEKQESQILIGERRPHSDFILIRFHHSRPTGCVCVCGRTVHQFEFKSDIIDYNPPATHYILRMGNHHPNPAHARNSQPFRNNIDCLKDVAAERRRRRRENAVRRRFCMTVCACVSVQFIHVVCSRRCVCV